MVLVWIVRYLFAQWLIMYSVRSFARSFPPIYVFFTFPTLPIRFGPLKTIPSFVCLFFFSSNVRLCILTRTKINAQHLQEQHALYVCVCVWLVEIRSIDGSSTPSSTIDDSRPRTGTNSSKIICSTFTEHTRLLAAAAWSCRKQTPFRSDPMRRCLNCVYMCR